MIGRPVRREAEPPNFGYVATGHNMRGIRIMSASEPIREGEGADIAGPPNVDREQQNPFTVRPPSSDHGNMPNLKWSFADSHMRIEEGGWAREATARELPISKTWPA